MAYSFEGLGMKESHPEGGQRSPRQQAPAASGQQEAPAFVDKGKLTLGFFSDVHLSTMLLFSVCSILKYSAAILAPLLVEDSKYTRALGP